jgi:hypothetical protein
VYGFLLLSQLHETYVHSSGSTNIIQIMFVGFQNRQTCLMFIGFPRHQRTQVGPLTLPPYVHRWCVKLMNASGQGTHGVICFCSLVTWQPTNIRKFKNHPHSFFFFPLSHLLLASCRTHILACRRPSHRPLPSPPPRK